MNEKPGLFGIGPPSSPGSVEPDGDEGMAGDVDVEEEAYRSAATELLSAIESKDVSAVAAALRAAADVRNMPLMTDD